MANAERGKPRLAENVVVGAAPSEAHTHRYTQFTWRPILFRPWCGGFCTMLVFILTLFNVYNTFECESTHNLYSFLMYCKQWLTLCLHKKLNLYMLILTQQIIRTLETCGISMNEHKAVFGRRNCLLGPHFIERSLEAAYRSSVDDKLPLYFEGYAFEYCLTFKNRPSYL
jgi:hypothetical protein